MTILSLENISCKVQSKTILKNISFCVEEGSVLGITGESGAGKSTLAKIIAGFISPAEGKLILNAETNTRSSPVQLLFQNTADIINPYRRITDIIEEAAGINNSLSESERKKEAGKLLEQVKLDSSLWRHRGSELSGGEQQRAALARLLAVKPRVLILDEPFASQDIESQVNLLNLLKNIKEEYRLTYICISHNIRILKNFTGEIIILKDGEIVESGNISEVLNTPSDAYTKLLLKAENYQLNDEESGSDKV